MTKPNNWGGQRPNQTGRPKLPLDQKRQSLRIVVDPATKPLAQLIIAKIGLGAWGHLVDKLILQEAIRLGIIDETP